jgi:hypothetical protein
MAADGIEADSFTCSWERSDDDGASFALSWRIDYRREPV